MQETSASFTAAVTAHRSWVPARLRTDWAGDGYDGDGSIDDLSVQMDESWEVDHTLEDGLPETVSFVSGTSVPEMSTNLTGRPDSATGAPITTSAYWSPLREDSPVYGYDRDVAPITLDAGLITDGGPEYVRVFTGQMANVTLRGGRAVLSTISATRAKLMKLVQMPAFSAIYGLGLRATWPVSWCLTQCGIYAGPKPREGATAWYAPMHGSAWEMIPATNRVYTAAELVDGRDFPEWVSYTQAATDPLPLIDDSRNVEWIDGPYVLAPHLQLTAAFRRAMYFVDIAMDRGAPDPFSQTSNAARLEMWVKGDATDVNNAPGGSGSVTRLCSLWGEAPLPTSLRFRLGINPTRNVEVRVVDGVNTRTLASPATLPADGAWHFVGAAFDMTANRLWVNLDGVVTSSTATMVTSGLPVTNQPTETTVGWADQYPQFVSALPVAEITLSTGPQANVDNYPLWRNDPSFAPTAVLHPSTMKLSGILEQEPREAWQIIAEYSGAELATTRITETDGFEFLPLGWWVRDEQQQVTEAFDTAVNAAAFDVDLDPTKVRNSIKLSYSQIDILGYNPELSGFRSIYELQQSDSNVVAIPPGTTLLKFTYSNPGIMPQQRIQLVDNLTLSLGWTGSWVSLCNSPDGIGAYAYDGQVVASVFSWDAGSITLRFVNTNSYAWYIANDTDVTPLRIAGLPVVETSTYVVDRDENSINSPQGNPRGERALEVTAPAVQTLEAARRLARNLKMGLRYPVATIGTDQQGVEVTANPARQPGALVTFRDHDTGVDGTRWRLRGVHHKGASAQYTQAVVARHAPSIMIIGQGRVGETLIGPPQD